MTSDHIDEELEFLKGLEFLDDMIKHAGSDTYYWKWVIHGMHNLLHAAFVLNLRGTWPVNLLTDRMRKKVLVEQLSRQFDERVWDGHLADFPTLYERVKNSRYMRPYVHSVHLQPTCEQDLSMYWLIRERNDRVHFRAMTWARDVSDHPGNLMNCLEVAKFLVLGTNNVIWHQDNGEQLAKDGLKQVDDSLLRCNRSMEAPSEDTVSP